MEGKMSAASTIKNEPQVDVLSLSRDLADEFRVSSLQRDRLGKTPKRERDLIRQSGLLKLSIPRSWGGWGVDWPTLYQSIRIISEGDSSLGHVYGFHHVLLATCRLFGSESQAQRLLSRTAAENWFWGNTLNPMDKRLVLAREGKELRLRGKKSYGTGSIDSDFLIVSALEEGTEKLVVAAIPTHRSGLLLHDDWSNMGQRATDSGSATFENVLLEEDEILGPPGPMGSVFAGLRPCVAQLVFVNVYLGIAQGALAEAKKFTREETKPWPWSGVDQATADPYVLEHFGNSWAELEGAVAVADKAAHVLQKAFEKGDSLTPKERGETAVAIATDKVLSSRAALGITSRIFEATGASATSAKWGLDRFWRNARTLTLHDRLDYKVRELGDWALNDKVPTPSLYS